MGEEVVDRSYKVVPTHTYSVQPAPVYVPPSPSFGLCNGRGPDLRRYGPGMDDNLLEFCRAALDGLAKKVA